MFLKYFSYELFVGMRYTRAKRKNHFISFISITSMIGIALGVAALIIVLSVMNGFQDELRTRILGVASHLQITGMNNKLKNWQSVSDYVGDRPHVLASAPYITAQAMLSYGQGVQGSIIRGIEPAMEERVADLSKHMKVGDLNALQAGEFGIVLGSDLAISGASNKSSNFKRTPDTFSCIRYSLAASAI